MKKALMLVPFLATSLLMANDNRLSGNERIALETSSPRVHLAKYHKKSKEDNIADAGKAGYRIEKNKTTIVAYMPVGK